MRYLQLDGKEFPNNLKKNSNSPRHVKAQVKQLKQVFRRARFQFHSLKRSDFQEHEIIGKGGFSIVRRATPKKWLTSSMPTEVALKIMDKNLFDRFTRIALEAEVGVHEEVGGHENIVTIYGSFETAEKIFIAMERMKGGDLYRFISRRHQGLSEHFAAQISLSIARALQHMHYKGYAHRDMKTRNVVLGELDITSTSNISVKLIDFGLAIKADTNKDSIHSYLVSGTKPYMAPEVHMMQQFDLRCGDVYALGVVMYEMIAHELPFIADGRLSSHKHFVQLKTSGASFQKACWHNCSNYMVELVKRCLERRPEDRPVLDDIILILEQICKNLTE